MITERELSKSSSLWRNIAPMIDDFARDFNRLAFENKSRSAGELKEPNISNSVRSPLIYETGFEIFASASSSGAAIRDLPKGARSRAANTAIEKLSVLSGGETDSIDRLSPWESHQATLAAENMRILTKCIDPESSIATKPGIRGRGFVDYCVADLIVGSCVVEIKSVRRAFHVADLRQVLTYAALNELDTSSPFALDAIGLINPQTGSYHSMPFGEVTQAAASCDPEEFLQRFDYVISSGEISR